MAANRGGNRPPKWQRYQIVAASVAGFVGVLLFVIQGFDVLIFGRDIDFGALPWTLTAIGAWVLFGVQLSSGFGGGPPDDQQGSL